MINDNYIKMVILVKMKIKKNILSEIKRLRIF